MSIDCYIYIYMYLLLVSSIWDFVELSHVYNHVPQQFVWIACQVFCLAFGALAAIGACA